MCVMHHLVLCVKMCLCVVNLHILRKCKECVTSMYLILSCSIAFALHTHFNQGCMK